VPRADLPLPVVPGRASPEVGRPDVSMHSRELDVVSGSWRLRLNSPPFGPQSSRSLRLISAGSVEHRSQAQNHDLSHDTLLDA
jgi:hypothetical protein